MNLKKVKFDLKNYYLDSIENEQIEKNEGLKFRERERE